MRETAADIQRETASGSFPLFLALAYDPAEDARRDPPRSDHSAIDLVVRTGGELRTSGFFPLQTLYSELWFTPTLFPDLTLEEMCSAIEAYTERKRRYGQ